MDFKVIKAEIIKIDESQKCVKFTVVEDSMFADKRHEIELFPSKEAQDTVLKRWMDVIESGNYPKYPARYILVRNLPPYKEENLYDEEDFPFLSTTRRVLIRVGPDGELTESPRHVALRELVDNGLIE